MVKIYQVRFLIREIRQIYNNLIINTLQLLFVSFHGIMQIFRYI